MNDTATRIEELQAKIDKTLRQSEAYRTCRDGSYEAALHFNGYYTLIKELKQLKGE
jgi:hypothetical protein